MSRNVNDGIGTAKKSSKSAIPHRVVTARRLARTAVAVMALGLLVAGGFLYYANKTTHKAMAIGPPIPPPLPEAGGARPWEVELPVSTYSSWHSRHGNTLTRIPITSISGTGPDLNMVLYHNTASVNESFDIMGATGFSLGEGWTIAYSSQLLFDDIANPTEITVVSDDGSQDVFTLNGSNWDPPSGVHDVLENVSGCTWRVTHKDQSYDEYFGCIVPDLGQLRTVADSIGNNIDISYNGAGGRMSFVAHNAGNPAESRGLSFAFDAQGRLEQIEDPRDEDDDPDPGEITDRFWTITYDVNDRLETITFPDTSIQIAITYDVDGRIETITDRHNPPPVPIRSTPGNTPTTWTGTSKR